MTTLWSGDDVSAILIALGSLIVAVGGFFKVLAEIKGVKKGQIEQLAKSTEVHEQIVNHHPDQNLRDTIDIIVEGQRRHDKELARLYDMHLHSQQEMSQAIDRLSRVDLETRQNSAIQHSNIWRYISGAGGLGTTSGPTPTEGVQ